MSMDGLAARARASKATIYRRWPGKAQVVAEAIRRRACPQGPAPIDAGSLRADLLAAVRSKCDTLSGEDGPLFIGLFMAARSDSELATLLRAQMQTDSQRFVAELVTRAVVRGEIPAGASPAVVQELVPALLLQRLIIGDQPADDSFTAHIVDDIIIPLLAAGRHAVVA